MSSGKIYLDNASTTRVKDDVLKAMLPYFSIDYGNPSSVHNVGEKARKAIDKARELIAKEINAKPWEIVFTSGTTESNNLMLFGLIRANRDKNKKKIIISAIEHASIIEPCEVLKREGFEIIRAPVDNKGIVDLDFLRREIDKNTLVVSVMHVNNVLGVVERIAEIGKICHERGVLFHTDAAQSFGKIEIDVRKMNVDLLSAGAHKIGGPKGTGFLYIRDGVKIEPLICGGGQERGLRGGTENVAGIVGFAKALEVSSKTDRDKIKKIRDYLIEEIENIGGEINGSKSERIYNNVHFSLKGIDAQDMVMRLSARGIYVSSGSACESKKEKEEHVLKAIGLKRDMIESSIRISLNDDTSKNDAEHFIRVLKDLYKIFRY